MKKTRQIGLFLFFVASQLAISCSNDGGSESSAGTPPTPTKNIPIPEKHKAIFIDAVVEGLTYKTEIVSIPNITNLNGVTDANGVFEFYDEHPVTFYAGDVKIGSVTVSGNDTPYITPLHLDGHENIDDKNTKTLLRFIQSLDGSGDSQKITVNPDEIAALAASDIESIKGPIKDRFDLMSDDGAKTHLTDTLTALYKSLWDGFEADHKHALLDGRIDAGSLSYKLPNAYRGVDVSWILAANSHVDSNGNIVRPSRRESDATTDVTIKMSIKNLSPLTVNRVLYISALPVELSDITTDSRDLALPLGRIVSPIITAILPDGSREAFSKYMIWSVADPTIAVVSSGTVKAIKEGSTTVTARYSDYSVQFDVVVGPKVLDAVAVTPDNPSVANGETLQLGLMGTYSDATTEALIATWSVSNMNPENLIEIDSSGLVTVSTNSDGSADVTAVYDGTDYTTRVTVSFKDIEPPTISAFTLQTVNGFIIPNSAIADNIGDVKFDLSADDDYRVVGYYVSEGAGENPPIGDPKWISVSPGTSVQLNDISIALSGVDEDKDDNQEKIIYVWVKDAFQNLSNPAQATYKLSTKIDYADGTANPLSNQQWHLKNTGQKNFSFTSGVAGNDINIETVHNTMGFKGRGVKIAVVDTGIESAHEDLGTPVLIYETASSDASKDSGTANAGLIGMRANNNLGGFGVAPKSELYSFNFPAIDMDDLEKEKSVLGNTVPNVFDLGYAHAYKTTDDRSAIYDAIETTLENSTALFVKAAGDGFFSDNSADVCSEDNGCQNTAHDPRNALKDIMIVNALNASGEKASYAATGSGIWISAPGGESGFGSVKEPGFPNPWVILYEDKQYVLEPALLSSDITGCTDGYSPDWILFQENSHGTIYDNLLPKNKFNGTAHLVGDKWLPHASNANCNYNASTYGTASASAITAGVAALLLEANPNLTAREIRYVLAITARKTDPNDDGWFQNNPPDSSPDTVSGIWFNDKYGFGAVDVGAAVQFVLDNKDGSIIGDELSSGWTGDASFVPVPVPVNDLAGGTSKHAISTVTAVETVQLKLSVTHADVTRLKISLISPSGTESIVYTSETAFKGSNLTNMYIRSNAFLNETGNGDWTLKVVDTSTSGTGGTITDWEINVIGH